MILRETNGFNVSNGSTRHRGFEYEAAPATARTLRACRSTARSRGTNTRSRAPSKAARPSSSGNDVDTAPRNLHSLESRSAGSVDIDGLAAAASMPYYVGRYFLDAANTAQYPGHNVANAAGRVERAGRLCDSRCASTTCSTQRYADRADFAFGNYRYFPARGRAVFLSVELRPQLRGTDDGLAHLHRLRAALAWDSSSTASRPAGTPSGSTCWWCS